MAKFENGWQIFGLFAGAALVSIGIIFFINAEAHSRYSNIDGEITLGSLKRDSEVDEVSERDQADRGLLNTLSSMKRSLQQFFSPDSTVDSLRSKRSADESENIQAYSGSLESNLLGDSLEDHKIRNIDEKVSKLSEKNQLIESVMRLFCQPKMTVKERILRDELNESLNKEVDLRKIELEKRFETKLKEFEEKFKQKEENLKKAHLAPPITSHDEVRQKSMPRVVDAIECRSNGEILVTVATTTLVNLIFFFLILICRNIINVSNDLQQRSEGYEKFFDEQDYEGDIVIRRPESRLSA